MSADKLAMAIANHLIMDLLRIITPEEVGEITTKHNGGRFLSLTELVNERVQKNIYRNFSQPMDVENNQEAKILPFKLEEVLEEEALTGIETPDIDKEQLTTSLTSLAQSMKNAGNPSKKTENHDEDENMSSFILIEKAHLKKAQKALKQKEILELYSKNLNVDVEQIRGQESNMTQQKESGILVNKKHY